MHLTPALWLCASRPCCGRLFDSLSPCGLLVASDCLYRPRPGENVTADSVVCDNITGVARQHAEWLTTAGFDYVSVDITNWPLTG